MSSYLAELLGHQEWADAEHWRAFESHPGALADKAIHERLYHIHLVQHAFLWMTGPQATPFDLKKLEDFQAMGDLKQYAQQGNTDLQQLLKSSSLERMEENITIGWFQPPLTISRRLALTQAAMHSHYHRGQNATRFREVGGTPPTTDFILWIKDGKPPARWY